MGFTRPSLRLSSDSGYADAASEDDDEKWEFAGALLVPSSSSSSDSSDDFEPSDASVLEHKPALPSRTISLSNIPMQMPVASEPAEVEGFFHVTTPVATPVVFTPPDHGLSRSALSHLKGFWSARQDEYARLEAQLALETNPYGGILEIPRAREGLRAALFSRLSRPGPRSPQHAPSSNAPPSLTAPIYPRTGDLSALHDTRSAVLDRAFRNLTLNTIQKILFLHDMLQRADRLPAPRLPSAPKAASSEDEDAFVDVSLGTLSSEDSSESTFVADEPPACHDCDAGSCAEQHAPVTKSRERVWEVDWVARWKVLLARVKEDPLFPTHTPSPSPVDEKTFWAAFSPPKPAKFFIPAEEDEFFGIDSDDGGSSEDDDDDYGVVLARPAWGVSADSLSREFLHNLCEYRLAISM